MPEAQAEGHIRAPEGFTCRYDVKHGKLADAIGMIKRHAVGAAAAAIVAGNKEVLEAKVAHKGDLILRHGPFGVGYMVKCRRRFTALAVAAQVGGDDCKIPCQARRNRVPHNMGLRMSVQEQQWWAVAAVPHAKRCLTRINH